MLSAADQRRRRIAVAVFRRIKCVLIGCWLGELYEKK